MRITVHNLLAILFFIIGSSNGLQAQDIHLSHIHASPVLLNPAMTALFNGDLRLIGNTRSQWQNVTNGYKTVVGSVDAQLYRLGRNDVLGGGLVLFSDKAGDLDFTTRSVSLDVSLLKSLDRTGTNFVSIGIQNSFINHSVDFSKITAFDIEPAIIEGASNKLNYWDISGGLAWFYAWNRESSLHLGVSAFHLNRPNNSFFVSSANDVSTNLFRKFVLHGGADLVTGKRITLKPSFMSLMQGPHRELTFGTFLKYKTFKNGNIPGASIYFGTWVRWDFVRGVNSRDAFIAAVRMDMKQTYITFSFDVNISTLSNVTKGHGGPELSIVKILHSKRGSRKPTKVKCPDF